MFYFTYIILNLINFYNFGSLMIVYEKNKVS